MRGTKRRLVYVKFIYNPLENGSPIGDPKNEDPKQAWVFNSVGYHHDIGKIKQYEDSVGEALLETYGFLQDLSSTEALKLKEELDNKKAFACKYCTFSTNEKIALSGHMRTHKAEIEAETKIDPDIIPLAEGQEVNPFTPTASMQKPVSKQVIDETTGSQFYGPGFEEKRGN